MSAPISACLIYKAGRGDQEAFDSLVHAMRINRRWGAFTQFPCFHDPPCEPCTREQHAELNKRINAILDPENIEPIK
jgi:hypothetical protein